MRLWIKNAERKVFQSTFHPTDCQYLESFDCVGPDDFIKLVRFVLEVKKDSVVNLQQYFFESLLESQACQFFIIVYVNRILFLYLKKWRMKT